MSDPNPPLDSSSHEDGRDEDHAGATEALRAAFTRLRPQGSDAWNFLAAFTHLGDRYGPYQPGASELSKQLELSAAGADGRPGTWRRRLLQRAGGTGTVTGIATGTGLPGDGTESELAQAMAQVVEAFRFLSARVQTLEERVAREDRPVDGAAWLLPAQELGSWVEPVAAHLIATTPGGEVLHGDCGTGLLLAALEDAGMVARGAEPRGTVALGALEQGRSVALHEVADELAAQPSASLGGLVLSGVVDRLPLHSIVSLLSRSRQALASGAPLVIVASDPARSGGQSGAVARDLVDPRPLHVETWEVLLQRAGFVAITPLAGAGREDTRVGLSAATPR